MALTPTFVSPRHRVTAWRGDLYHIALEPDPDITSCDAPYSNAAGCQLNSGAAPEKVTARFVVAPRCRATGA